MGRSPLARRRARCASTFSRDGRGFNVLRCAVLARIAALRGRLVLRFMTRPVVTCNLILGSFTGKARLA